MQRTHQDTNNFVFWADNCCAQNKNWILYGAIVNIMSEDNAPQSVTMLYLTKGNTHNRADSIHGNIECNLRHVQVCETFDQMIRVIEKSRKKLRVLPMDLRDFHSFDESPKTNKKDYMSLEILSKCGSKKTRDVEFKYDFECEYKTVFLKMISPRNLSRKVKQNVAE